MVLLPVTANAAEPQLVTSQKKLDPETESLWKLSFSGVIDARFVHTGKERNWSVPSASSTGNSAGGRGLTRYGGVDRDENGTGDSSMTAFKLPQAYLVTDITYGDSFGAHLQLQFDDVYEGNERVGNFGLTEAYLAYDHSFSESSSARARFGLLIPPVSFEHPNTAWTTEYTVTPSAINTWIGEEIRPTGLELTWRKKMGTSEVSAMVAPFSENDASGTLLAFRGWTMHDLLVRRGLRMRHVDHAVGPPSRSSNALVETDGRLGAYGQLAWKNSGTMEFRLYGYENNGNEETMNVNGDHAWNTDFLVASAKVEPFSGFTFITQALKGKTAVRPATPQVIDTHYYSYYALASYLCGKERFSLRYDQFRVIDRVFPADEENQKGHALTAAYMHRFNAAHTAGIEWLHVKSQRPGNAPGFGVSDPSDDQLQLAYRFTF